MRKNTDKVRKKSFNSVLRPTSQKPSVVEFMKNSPLQDIDLDLEKVRSPRREIGL